jgi:sec-independent protein translocase protein TatB
MFEFDASKLIIIGIVALIVIGPKELPRVLRQVGQAMAKLRRMAAEFQSQFADAMREAELSEIQDEAAKLAASTKIDAGFNPIAQLRHELTRAIDAPGTTTAGPPVKDDSEALPPAAEGRGPDSILAADGSEGPDGHGMPESGHVAEAGRGELSPAADALGAPEGGQPPHSDLGGDPFVARPTLGQVAPVSRT